MNLFNLNSILLSKFLKIILNIFWYIGLISFVILSVSSILSNFNNNYGILNTIFSIGVLIIVACILLIIFHLRKILNTIINKKPFSLSNVSRFRYIGITTIFIGILLFIKDIYFIGLKTFTIIDDSQGLFTNVDIYIPILIGLFSLILAEIFKMGYQIYEENKLTI